MDRLYARDDLNKTLGKDELMKKQLKAMIICIICASVIFTAIAIAKEPSVLERAKTVDNRELGELIRIAIENLPETNALKRMAGRRPRGSGDEYVKQKHEYDRLMFELESAEETARARVIRSVTEVYSQIKLLDSQIKETGRKMASLSSSDSIFTELTLAIAELEAKRSTELAQIRQIMNIVPKYAFGHKPANTLNGWLVLDVIGDKVYSFKVLRPFKEHDSITGKPRYSRQSKTEVMKKMPVSKVVGFVKGYIKDKSRHPFRIDITKNAAGLKASEELYADIIRTIKAEELELESVVYLQSGAHDSSRYTYYFRNNNILSRYRGNPIDYSAQDYIKERARLLRDPKYLPFRAMLEFDEESEELAKSMSDAILAKAKEFNIEELVEIKRVLCFEIFTDGSRIYKSYNDIRDSNSKFVSVEDFIKEILGEQLKRAEKHQVKYIVSSGRRNVNLDGIIGAINATAKEASVDVIVERK